MTLNELPNNITNIVCSFSGGKSSAMMAFLLKNVSYYKRFKLHFVFANTGKELLDTILFVKDCAWLFDIKIHLIEADVNEEKGVGTSYKIIEDYTKLSMDGEPYEAVIKKYGLPSVALPHCTRELKIVPISKFIKYELGLTKQNCVQAIGFRADEKKRINPKPQFIYPLNEAGIVKADVLSFWQKEDFKRWALPLEEFEGNCDFCFKKCWSKLKQMAEKHKTRMLWWNNMENKYWVAGEAIFRGHKVILDLIDNVDHSDEDIACACGKSEDFFEIN